VEKRRARRRVTLRHRLKVSRKLQLNFGGSEDWYTSGTLGWAAFLPCCVSNKDPAFRCRLDQVLVSSASRWRPCWVLPCLTYSATNLYAEPYAIYAALQLIGVDIHRDDIVFIITKLASLWQTNSNIGASRDYCPLLRSRKRLKGRKYPLYQKLHASTQQQQSPIGSCPGTSAAPASRSRLTMR
jgi:hypothetical protein